ncbi:MAG: FKBP-type peptidyl-prolyl cis-trans isomerase [Pseudomonadota bacterium]
MLRLSLPALAVALALPALPVLAQSETPAEGPALESVESRYSYGLGLQIGQTLRQQGIDNGLDPEAFALGIRDFLSDTDPRLTMEEVQAAYVAMQQALAEQQQAVAAEALVAGEAFLAENATVEGVTVTDSGLQYKVIKEGEGESPGAEDTVKVDYEGRLLSGSVFDSSYARGEPAEFGVGQVIAGWTEALQLMKPGGVLEVWLHPSIAYGERGAGGDIGPNEVLNFRIELIEIVE